MRHNKEIIIISVDPVFHKDGTSLKKVYWDNDGTTELVHWKNDTLVIPMVTDRTIDDVIDWETLRNKIINQTATASEIAEWKTYEMRGCLNHTDFNRYGKVLKYLAVSANQITYPYPPKQIIHSVILVHPKLHTYLPMCK